MKASLTLLAAASFLTIPVLAQPKPAQPPTWVHSLAEAQQLAATNNKPILVYCWMDGSDYCTKLYQDTLSAEDATGALGDYICYSAKHGGAGVQDVFKKYGVTTMPTMLFLTADGKADDLIQGFIPVDQFVKELDRVKQGEGTVTALEKIVATAKRGSHDDVDARWQLAGKIQALGEGDRHDKLMDSIREVDPKGATLVGSRLLVGEILNKIAGKDGDGNDGDEQAKTDEQRAARMKMWDLTPLYAHAKSVKLNAAKHEVWQRIGDMEVGRENMQSAFKAFHAAWKSCPEDKVVDWSNAVAHWIIKGQEQRTSKEKKFALDLANAALATLKQRLKTKPPTEHDQEMYTNYEAYCWNTIAWCHHINGKKGPAVKAAKKALKLSETDKYAKDLATMRE